MSKLYRVSKMRKARELAMAKSAGLKAVKKVSKPRIPGLFSAPLLLSLLYRCDPLLPYACASRLECICMHPV